MKLKTRLFVAFLIIIFVPVFLTGIAFWGLTNYKLKALEEHYGIETDSYENLSNSIQLMSKITKTPYQELKETAKAQPGALEDKEYLEEVNADLKERLSFLVVKKDGRIIYTGSDGDINPILTKLPSYNDYDASSDSGIYVGGSKPMLVKQLDFQYAGGAKGSAYIVTRVDNLIPQVKSMMTEMLIVIVLILFITSAILTMWIYRGVASPLKKLKKATQDIKDGNLDFTLEAEGADEIGELCQDFEEMRRRLKDSAEEKVEYDQDNKELISNISHDLKTPITAVKGYVEGIMDGVADTPEKMQKYIKTIYNKANEMDRLINELTFYSKIDTNKIPYTFSKLNVNEYFQDCADELGIELEAEGIALDYWNDVADGVQIIGDAEQLKRVINNIISNSVKYMDKKQGFIHIRVRDVGDFIQVELEDNGRGIAPRDLPYIFDRFYRTDASRNSSKGGSGIGLSIVKKIVEDHGGKIWATSKEASGTVMYFVLRKFQEVPIHE